MYIIFTYFNQLDKNKIPIYLSNKKVSFSVRLFSKFIPVYLQAPIYTLMLKLLSKIISKIGWIFIGISNRVYSRHSRENLKTLKKWYKDNGDSSLRLNYNLNENSLVFDLGGYEGQWTSDIFSKYLCEIHVFEPSKRFAENIQKRFAYNPKVIVHPFGLSSKTEKVELSIAGDASSTINKQNLSIEQIQLIAAFDFFNENKINNIDLMKINIEGGEFDLLKHLIDNNFIAKIKNIQVQFHCFVPNAEEKLNEIYQNLQKTHKLTYHYKYVWENWELI
jgi:FkbM family methyltransferase